MGMKLKDNEFAMNFERTTRKIVLQVLAKMGLVKMRSGTVKTVNNTLQTAEIYLAGDEDTVVSTYLNRTGQDLAVDDLIYLVSIDGTLNNAFVGWKRGTYVSGGSGVTTFTALTDVPSSYSGQGGKTVKINSGETGLEFVNVSSKSSFCANDSTGGIVITNSFQTLNLDNTILSDSNFSLSIDEITISNAGRYWIDYEVVLYEVDDTLALRCTVETKVDLYTTSYTTIAQSYAKSYARETTEGTSSGRGFLAEVSAGDKIRIQFRGLPTVPNLKTEQYYSSVSIYEI